MQELLHVSVPCFKRFFIVTFQMEYIVMTVVIFSRKTGKIWILWIAQHKKTTNSNKIGDNSTKPQKL